MGGERDQRGGAKPQKRTAAVAILDARLMWFEHEATPVCVDRFLPGVGERIPPVEVFMKMESSRADTIRGAVPKPVCPDHSKLAARRPPS